MTGLHVKDRAPDMVPGLRRHGTPYASQVNVDYIRSRWETRPSALNESGKLEWLYLPGVRHGAHDATPTIAEIAATEPCEKTTGWPTTSCATRSDLRVASDEWATSYCLPCRIRAALDREEHRPICDPFAPWPAAATDVLAEWITTNTRYRHPTEIELVMHEENGYRRALLIFTEDRGYNDRGTVEEVIPWKVGAKAHYIATGVWL